jgi:hypothetical protein
MRADGISGNGGGIDGIGEVGVVVGLLNVIYGIDDGVERA